MSTPSSPARQLRRIAAGVSLILFPALLVPQALIDPAAGGTGEVMVTAATEHRSALTISAALLFVSGVLMVPAVMGILRQARDRGAALANLGSVLGVLGGIGHIGLAMFYLFALPLPGGERAEMVSYVERINASPVVMVAFPLILCFGLSMAVLPWAAWRSGSVGIWGPVLATAALLVHLGLPFEPPAALSAVLLTALTVVFGYLGLRVLLMPQAGWDGYGTTSALHGPGPLSAPVRVQ